MVSFARVVDDAVEGVEDQLERIDAVEIRPAQPQSPERLMGNEPGDEPPFAYREPRGDRRQGPMRVGLQAADVDMKLVLRPHDARVDDQQSAVVIRQSRRWAS